MTLKPKPKPSAERVAAAVEKYLDAVRGGNEAFEARSRRRRLRKRTSAEELRRKEAKARGKRWF